MVVEVKSRAQEAIGKREEGEKPLVVEQDHLRTRLIVVEAQIEKNQVAKGKLIKLKLVVVVHFKGMQLLPPVSKTTEFMRKNLEKKLKEVKEEVQLAEQFLRRIIPPAAVGQPQAFTPFISLEMFIFNFCIKIWIFYLPMW